VPKILRCNEHDFVPRPLSLSHVLMKLVRSGLPTTIRCSWWLWRCCSSSPVLPVRGECSARGQTWSAYLRLPCRIRTAGVRLHPPPYLRHHEESPGLVRRGDGRLLASACTRMRLKRLLCYGAARGKREREPQPGPQAATRVTTDPPAPGPCSLRVSASRAGHRASPGRRAFAPSRATVMQLCAAVR
jgi:hypothetical protein